MFQPRTNELCKKTFFTILHQMNEHKNNDGQSTLAGLQTKKKDLEKRHFIGLDFIPPLREKPFIYHYIRYC